MRHKKYLIFLFVTLFLCFSSFVFAQGAGLNSKSGNNFGKTPLEFKINNNSLWYSEYLQGVKVGYRNIKRYNAVLNNKPVIVSSSYSDIVINRLNSTVHLTDKADCPCLKYKQIHLQLQLMIAQNFLL